MSIRCNHNDYALLNMLEHVPVHFLSFRSSVGALMRDGWEVHQEFDCIQHMQVIWFSHQDLRLGARVEVDMHASYSLREYENGRPLIIQRVVPNDRASIMMHNSTRADYSFTRLTTDATATEIRINEIMECGTFCLADLLQPEKTPELIVDPNDVDELMSRILEVQRPKQKELRERQVRESRGVKTIQANLVTFGKVA